MKILKGLFMVSMLLLQLGMALQGIELYAEGEYSMIALCAALIVIVVMLQVAVLLYIPEDLDV